DPDSAASKKASERHVALCLDILDQTEAHPFAQVGAYFQLAQMGSLARSAVPVLEAALNDGNDGIRLMTAATLVLIQPGHEAAVRVLTPTIPELVRSAERSKNALSEGRVFAIRVLGSLGPTANSAIPALERASRDHHQGVQEAAIDALK